MKTNGIYNLVICFQELLALEERIGNVNTGLTEENISSCMKLKTYVTMTGQPDAEPCCICQVQDFSLYIYFTKDTLWSCVNIFYYDLTGRIQEWR